LNPADLIERSLFSTNFKVIQKDRERNMKFCDHDCKFAQWPEDLSIDGSGSCRTFQAVYCLKKERHVHKNMPCDDKSEREK
jgi:hypothetical protein